MTAAFGSDPFGRSPIVQQPRGNTIRLRIEFFSYEREVIQTQISAYIKKLSRKHPSFKAQDHQLLHVHDIMQFQVLGETSHVLAYDYFPIEVNLIQQVRPAQLYLSATIPGFEQNFINASYTDALIDSLGRSTVLRLDTENGFLPTPPMPDLTVESELVISTFHLNILLENLSFATTPFQVYSPVEARGGTLHFPANPSYFGQPVQQTQYYSHQLPTFSVPAPVLEPPQLINNMNDDSIPWNTVQQRYMDVNRARDDQQQHARTVRDRLNPANTNISDENVQPVISVSTPSAPVLTDPLPSTSSFSTSHVAPLNTIVQSQPVIGSADPNTPFVPTTQSGLPQSRPGDIVQQPQPSIAVPTSQPSTVLPQNQTLQSDSVSVDDSVDSVPDATALVHRPQYPGDPRLQSLLDNMVLTSQSGTPTYKFNFPHLLQNALRFDESNYRLTNVDNMHWDDVSLNLSHQIDHYVPQPAPHVSRMLTGVGPPLAQSVGQPSTGPRYPHLPTSSNALFGPRCTQTPLPSFPAPHTIQPDFLASQPPVLTVPNNDPAMTAP